MAHDDPDIKRLREKFVCARITRMNGVDIRRFEFDLDTTWTAFFLDENLNVYSRYGGRDETAPESRLNKKSLLQTMREVLDVHANRKALQKLGRSLILQPSPSESLIPQEIPLLEQNHQGCIHCHQVREYQLLQWSHDGKFSREKLFGWPLPRNVGVVFDQDHGHRVEKILPASTAASARLQAGDIILQVDDVPVHSEYDFRWALHRASGKEPLEIHLRRKQKDGPPQRIAARLKPEGNWRQTELGWRKSLRSVPLPLGFRAYALVESQREKSNLPQEKLALRVISIRDRGLAQSLKLKRLDVIVALEGKDTSRKFKEFQSDLLRLYKPGDKVHLTVWRKGELQKLTGTFPEWSIEETSVP